MATDVARPTNLFARLAAFFASLPEGYENVRGELRKVTWPDRGQIRQATIGIIAVVLFVGAVIALLDVSLQFVLVRVPSMLTGR
jgi:preprotein translocase SecE subunit